MKAPRPPRALDWLRDRAVDARALAHLLGGLAYYGIHHDTPESAYQGMIRLFCQTGGWSNDLISRAISALRPPQDLPSHTGVLGSIAQQRATIRDQLDRDGYYVFDQRLDEATCDRLLAFSLRTPSVAQNGGPDGSDTKIKIDRRAPRAVRYELEANDLVANADVQALMADWSLLTVAQDYLRASPILDIIAMWWHTAFSDQPDARAAQMFHFDMDRPRWLKFFVYLTDVTSESGPHCFIRGSHRTGAIPADLLARGYSRLDDEAVAAHFPPEDHIRFVGRKGTIIAEDTRGLHKGQHVENGDRLVFQLEFTNTLFGGAYARPRLDRPAVADLEARVRDYPRVYSFLEGV